MVKNEDKIVDWARFIPLAAILACGVAPLFIGIINGDTDGIVVGLIIIIPALILLGVRIVLERKNEGVKS